VTSCSFGGKNFEDLYITSAKIGLSENELAQQPLAGCLLVIKDCGFKSIAAVEFPYILNRQTIFSQTFITTNENS
jgi:hypothetical protein